MEREQMVDAVRDWLDNNDWHYEYNAEKQFIKMGINLGSKIKSGTIIVSFRDACYTVYLYTPINGDKDNIGELNKYLTMANFGLRNGNFELNVHDGEIRYKTFVNCNGLESLSEKIIQDSICIGCLMMDRYGDGIAALALGFSDAETEIQKAEHTDEEDADGGDADDDASSDD